MRTKKVLREPLERLLTERANRVLNLTREEAVAHHHEYVFPEHLLLGLIRLNKGVAVHSLIKLGVSPQAVRDEIEQRVGRGTYESAGETPFGPRTEQALKFSRLEAFELGHRYIGTEHLLLGIIREGQNAAADVLIGLGIDSPKMRQKIITVLNGPIPSGWA